MRTRAKILATLAAIAFAPFLSACAGIEQTFRDANGVVNEVIDLSEGADTPTQKAPLYAIEDRLEAACAPLFKSANARMVGGDVSMFTKVSALVSSEHCRHTVNQAKQDLDRYREDFGDAPQVADAETPKTL